MRTVVAVLRGGPSMFAAESLKSGAAVLQALEGERYDARDVFISPEGYWHRGGESMEPYRALMGADAVFNCIHGYWGGDGWLAGLIAKLGYPMVGSSQGPLSLAFNREQSKVVATRLGFLVPPHRVVTREAHSEPLIMNIFRSMPMPVVVKPVAASPKKVILVADVDTLLNAVKDSLTRYPAIVVEEAVGGAEASAHIVEGWRQEPYFTAVSGEADGAEKALIAEAAKKMHQELGLSGFSQSDFIVNSRGLWYLGTDALPPMHEDSLFVRGLNRHKIPLSDFLGHTIEESIK